MREAQFKITQGDGNNNYQAWMKDGEEWKPLRVTPTTFESAQAAMYDMLVDWAFPRVRK